MIPNATPTPIQIISDPRAAAGLLDPLRREILERLRTPNSASGIAHSMGQPRQIINYHLRELEALALVRHREDRKKGNCTERIMQASAESYLISPEAFAAIAADPAKHPDRLSAAYLLACAGRMIRDLGKAVQLAAAQEKSVATLTIDSEIRFASPDKRTQFTSELAQFLLELTAKYHSPKAKKGRAFRWLFCAYPKLQEESA